MWVHHHAIFKHVRRCDAWVHFANGCLLLMVTVVPYPTSVVAAYLTTPAAKMAVAFYCGAFVLIAVGFNLVLRAAFRKRMLIPSTSMDFVAKTCRSYLAGPPLYSLALLAAFLDVRLALGICTALWIFWAATITRNTQA